MGLPSPEQAQGRSLGRPARPDRIVPAQLRRQLALVQGPLIHLYGPGWFGPGLDGSLFEGPDGEGFLARSGPARRFDYRADPLGLRPLDDFPGAERLDQEARGFLARALTSNPGPSPSRPPTGEREELAARLRDLGYL